MDALKKMYADLNFEDIETYVQSGNVIFSSEEENPKKIEKIISASIAAEFEFEVPVIVLNTDTLETIIEANPFAKDEQKGVSFLHVTFLADHPLPFDKEIIIQKKQANEEIEFTPDAIYLYCPDGYGRTKLNTGFLEKKLKVKATTRNWKTTNKLLKIATE